MKNYDQSRREACGGIKRNGRSNASMKARPAIRCLPWFASGLVFLLAGCGILERSTKAPVQAVMTAMPGGKNVHVDPVVLQFELQRYVDDFASRTANALNEYSRHIGTDQARRQELAWKLAACTSAFSIASGPNPTANLIDLIAMSTVTRHALENHWVGTTNGAAFQPWLEAARVLETNAWKLADGVLTPEQQHELRDAIRLSQESNTGPRFAFFERSQEFAAVFRQTTEKKQTEGGLVSLVGLDPTAGLDPAVRELAKTRLFAERALFTAQRMPSILRWQVELLADDLVHHDEVATVLTNAPLVAESADRLSRAVESVSQTAAQLPDRITAERKAVLAALETQETGLRKLSAEVTRTLEAGDKMSTSLNTALSSFDGLMKRFGVGEPSTKSSATTNAAPFNILDYARAAEQVAIMARELDALIKDTSGTLDSPALSRYSTNLNALVTRSESGARSLLNRAFLLAAGLVVLTFTGVLACRKLAPSRPARS